jgi:hypothetical protein
MTTTAGPFIRCSLTRLRQIARQRATGYLEEVLATAVTVSGDDVFLTVNDRDWLRAKYDAIEAALGEPSLLDLARNFHHAITKWSVAGFPVVSATEYQSRAVACDACEFWDAQARAGLGHCRHHACGCTKLKRWLATEHCPIGRWPSIEKNIS